MRPFRRNMYAQFSRGFEYILPSIIMLLSYKNPHSIQWSHQVLLLLHWKYCPFQQVLLPTYLVVTLTFLYLSVSYIIWSKTILYTMFFDVRLQWYDKDRKHSLRLCGWASSGVLIIYYQLIIRVIFIITSQ